jgi:XTP/dITP diphosphohydrolase
MIKTLLIATGNQKKRTEMEELTSDLGWEIKTLRDFPPLPDVVEDGTTFVENARKKAVHYANLTGFLTLADDSGLVVDALGGRPGIYSARYAAGEGSSDAANLLKVLDEMADVPEPERTARFVCAAVVASTEAVLFETQQTVEGLLLYQPIGDGGFGYDPIFYYPPFLQTFAEIPSAQKHTVSHRGKALRDVSRFLHQLT